MSLYRDMISPSQLSLLLKGPTVKIAHASFEDDTPTVICNAMPKAVVKHFSPFLDDCFPPADKLHVRRKGCDGATHVTICGGVKAAFIYIFQWMLASCRGTGLQRIERLEFAQYARLHEAATLLGIPRIQQEMATRMDKMSKSQVPIKDVRIIYENFPRDALARQIVIRSIGDAIFERRLRRWDLYKDFKLECIEYDDDIYSYIEGKKRAIREAEMLENRRQERRRRKKGGSKEYQPVAREPPQVVNKTVQGVVTRKGRGAQPTYVRVGLEDLGVSNQQFSRGGKGYP
ncbi:uncharacterized protein CIMG_03771 [Coccidioides immitis RS]|uniref:BTB domain-containing protein n=2 Tax=Coccidioides immitis TaxID=5501 RepID=A0A0E1RWS9_COCIM|nr:uncharacterized protein CIMG_03771 [Coccidioides immitis RS]EAS32747.1 hypothetical protein CIMG_03771 [Coccidioides immitis RS]